MNQEEMRCQKCGYEFIYDPNYMPDIKDIVKAMGHQAAKITQEKKCPNCSSENVEKIN